MPFAGVPTGAAQRHSMIQGAIISDLSCLTDDHSHAMVDKEATANSRTGMDLDTGQPT